MTRSDLPKPDMRESSVHELHALYHEAATDEPGPLLDRRILDAARAELHAHGATRRQAPWWKGWIPALSAVALVMVGLSVTWRVLDEQEHRLREDMQAAEGMRASPGQTVGGGASADRPADTGSAINVQTPAVEKSRRVEPPAVQEIPAGMPERAAKAFPAAPAAMAPGTTGGIANEVRRAEKDELRERRDAGAAVESTAGPVRQSGKLDARSLGAGGATAADTLAQPAADAATPDAWLMHIRELRAAGRSAEAAQSLARFRTHYPDFVLPDDLLKLK